MKETNTLYHKHDSEIPLLKDTPAPNLVIYE